MDSDKAGTDGGGPLRRTLERVEIMILHLSAQVPLGALSSLCSAEPSSGRGDIGLHGVSLLDKSEAPNCPFQQGVLAVCLCRNWDTWLFQDPQWLLFIQGKIKCTFPGLAVQGPAYTMQPLLTLPLLLNLPKLSLRGLPTKCSSFLLHKFIPSARKSWPPIHLSSNVSSSGKSSLICWSSSNTPSLSMPQHVWVLALVTSFVA